MFKVQGFWGYVYGFRGFLGVLGASGFLGFGGLGSEYEHARACMKVL